MARRALESLGSHYLRDIGIERDGVDAAVEGLLRTSHAAPHRGSLRRGGWHRMLGVSRWASYQTACDTGHQRSA